MLQLHPQREKLPHCMVCKRKKARKKARKKKRQARKKERRLRVIGKFEVTDQLNHSVIVTIKTQEW